KSSLHRIIFVLFSTSIFYSGMPDFYGEYNGSVHNGKHLSYNDSTMDVQRILTGDRPTGPHHIGHYFGTLQNRVKLQNEGHEIFLIVADYQVLTDRMETELIEQNICEIVRGYIATGIDPQKSTIFVQSQIPELAELTLLFSMITSMNRVARNPTVKEEINAMNLEDTVSLGMFSYPVSQAADILLFNPDLVPVGEDQLPHVELTREIARKFNRLFGDVFKIPEAMLSDVPRLVGLDGDNKMSKSRGNAIFLKDDEDTVMKKVKSAVTDSGREIVYDRAKKPNLSNLIDLYHLVSGKTIEDIVNLHNGDGYGEFKEALGQEIITFFKPFQERVLAYSDKDINKIATDGTKRAALVAKDMMSKTKKAMKIQYGF
ncbi:tryptophan--tRNA ligase, partial [candidate division WWE3 bacterium CG22_combo_CG10-13_8_21_14_all_39_12]